jgi:D-threonate/D-erythronate kinase
MILTIVADDLTGSCDTGTLFAGKEPVPVTVWPGVSADGTVSVIDTESRSLPAEAARERAAAAAGTAGSDRVFKKIDSTLRGPIGDELDAVMTAIDFSSAVVCPAFPAQGRVVRDGLLSVHGVALADTPLGQRADAGHPASSDVATLIGPGLGRRLVRISLAEVRAGAASLAVRLNGLTAAVAVADAETDDDLDTLVDAALDASPAPLLAGAAGLARALARRLGLLAEGIAMPETGRWLIVAGSLHPATRRQIASARSAGLTVLATPEADEPDCGDAANRLAQDAVKLLETGAFDLVAVTGGDTAVALYRILDAERIDLVGAPRPGLALGQLRMPRHAGLWLLTKAGGFGEPDLFVSLAQRTP